MVDQEYTGSWVRFNDAETGFSRFDWEVPSQEMPYERQLGSGEHVWCSRYERASDRRLHLHDGHVRSYTKCLCLGRPPEPVPFVQRHGSGVRLCDPQLGMADAT
jgi:hypothetical protein